MLPTLAIDLDVVGDELGGGVLKETRSAWRGACSGEVWGCPVISSEGGGGLKATRIWARAGRNRTPEGLIMAPEVHLVKVMAGVTSDRSDEVDGSRNRS